MSMAYQGREVSHISLLVAVRAVGCEIRILHHTNLVMTELSDFERRMTVRVWSRRISGGSVFETHALVGVASSIVPADCNGSLELTGHYLPKTLSAKQ